MSILSGAVVVVGRLEAAGVRALRSGSRISWANVHAGPKWGPMHCQVRVPADAGEAPTPAAPTGGRLVFLVDEWGTFYKDRQQVWGVFVSPDDLELLLVPALDDAAPAPGPAGPPAPAVAAPAGPPAPAAASAPAEAPAPAVASPVPAAAPAAKKAAEWKI